MRCARKTHKSTLPSEAWLLTVRLHHCSWFLRIHMEKVCCPEGISYFVSQLLFQSSMKSGQTSILNILFCHPTFLLSSCGLMIRQGHQKSRVKQISALIYMGLARLCCSGVQSVSSLHCRMCVYTCMIYIYIYMTAVVCGRPAEVVDRVKNGKWNHPFGGCENQCV